jgi:hypothetical protein
MHEQVEAIAPWVEAAAVHTWIDDHAAVLLPGEEVLAHGDPHLENVLWDEDHGLTLLDLEWSRRSVAEVDLEILLHFFRDPARFVSPEDEARAHPEDYAAAPAWLREDYPELFLHPDRETRLRVLWVSRLLGFLVDEAPELSPERVTALRTALA